MSSESFTDWIGRSEQHIDTIRPAHARLLQATLDQEPTLKNGDQLPPLWHFIYFLEGKPRSELGPDGHPAKGGFLPPITLPRRMWAGGRVTFNTPVIFGEKIARTSTITNVSQKEGRSGKLCFVTVRHDLAGEDGAVRLSEEQDIVYREAAAPGAPTPKPIEPPTDADDRQTISPDPTLLFRYSALTFNGHRIHYDADYVRDVEGYPGLIFHGPLTATLLAGQAQEKADAPLKSFEFRAVAPLFDTAPFDIATKSEGNRCTVWAETPAGDLAMTASATI